MDSRPKVIYSVGVKRDLNLFRKYGHEMAALSPLCTPYKESYGSLQSLVCMIVMHCVYCSKEL